MNLMSKLMKNSTAEFAETVEKSMFFEDRDMIPTPVPMINVALSGDVNGGLTSGVTVLAGPSKNFKTGFGLLLASSYLNKYDDSVVLFYDTEFGTPSNYFDMFGISTDRVFHTPVSDIEQLKHDLINQIKELERGEKVIIIIDSIGNLASVKEIEDATSGKQVADMTRAKSIKSFFRMITPYAALKDIPIVVINHTYKEIGLFPKDIVSGGTGVYYSADNIWILGRRQDKKPGEELKGYDFVINVEKSRFVKEKSKINISASFDKGISKYSGLFDLAVDLGYIEKVNNVWYKMKEGPEEGKFRKKEKELDEVFWKEMLNNELFTNAIHDKYSLSSGNMLEGENVNEK